MWNFAQLAQARRPSAPSPAHAYPAFSHNRTEGMSTSKKDALVNMGIYKLAAVTTAGLTGGISAYKGLPEIKDFAGGDVILGTLLGFAEAAMLYKGVNAKATAVVGGMSTGLLCHWMAVQGTLWGATKAKADANKDKGADTKNKGWDYDNPHQLPEDTRVQVPEHTPPQTTKVTAKRSAAKFDLYGTV